MSFEPGAAVRLRVERAVGRCTMWGNHTREDSVMQLLTRIAVLVALTALPVSASFNVRPIPPEYQALLCDWYARYLGRPIDPAAMETWGRKLVRGDSPRQVEAALLGSREYFQRNGNNNIGFIRGLFRDVMSTEPQGGQLEYWLEKLNDFGYRDDLAEHFLKAARKAGAIPAPLATPFPVPTVIEVRPSYIVPAPVLGPPPLAVPVPPPYPLPLPVAQPIQTLPLPQSEPRLVPQPSGPTLPFPGR